MFRDSVVRILQKTRLSIIWPCHSLISYAILQLILKPSMYLLIYFPLDRVLFSGLSVLNRILTCPGMNRSGFEILCCTPIPLPLGEDICLHGCVRYRCINRLSAKTPKNCVHFSPPLKGTLS